MGEIEKLAAFAKKRAAVDGNECTIGEAEEKDLTYLIENSCLHCNRLIGKNEVKILPPSYIQDRDPHVSRGVVRKRLMCINCYNLIRSSAREKVRFDRFKNSGIKDRIRMSMGRMFLHRQFNKYIALF